MDILSENDIAALFKKLVILNDDQNKDEPDKTDEKAGKDSSESIEKVSPTSEDQETLTLTPESPSPAQYPTSVALIAGIDVLSTLQNNSSNFIKICNALSISHLVDTAIEFESIKDFKLLTDSACLWVVGLSLEQQKAIMATKHPNILISPNTETLSSKEEKAAMYRPLQAFVSTNLEHFSKI